MSKSKEILKMLKESSKSYPSELGNEFVTKINGKKTSYRFHELNGSMESGMEIDVEFSVGKDHFTYKGAHSFKVKKNGKIVDSGYIDSALGADPDSFVESLIAEYAKQLGASSSEIDALFGMEGWFFRDGSMVIEDEE